MQKSVRALSKPRYSKEQDFANTLRKGFTQAQPIALELYQIDAENRNILSQGDKSQIVLRLGTQSPLGQL